MFLTFGSKGFLLVSSVVVSAFEPSFPYTNHLVFVKCCVHLCEIKISEDLYNKACIRFQPHSFDEGCFGFKYFKVRCCKISFSEGTPWTDM